MIDITLDVITVEAGYCNIPSFKADSAVSTRNKITSTTFTKPHL